MILQKIIDQKKKELNHKDFGSLAKSARNFKSCLVGKNNIIAEIKPKSPSYGSFGEIDIKKTAKIYSKYANAISVLTDKTSFGGCLEHIELVTKVSNLPVLRKDFIIDESQILESRHYGADAVLLIAAILSDEQIDRFITLAGKYGMDCLVEVHNEEELNRVLKTKAEIIGINNRDLSTLEVDINTTNRLKRLIPSNKIVVSESGFSSLDEIKSVGVNAVLIGTSFMKDPYILPDFREPKIKICGITTAKDAQEAVKLGADYIGFNFYEKCPRYISPDKVKKIIPQLPNTVVSVGVFVNEAVEKVKKAIETSGIDMVQFHGDESPEYCSSFCVPVIKAFSVNDKMPDYSKYNVFGYLFDTFDKDAYGGTGKRFDSSIVKNADCKVFISGGLNSFNVAEPIRGLDPYCVDVCSGVESKKGIKCGDKMQRFFEAVNNKTGFGRFGGMFVPETLMPALNELENAYLSCMGNPKFKSRLDYYLKQYAGRPTSLYFAENFSKRIGCRVYLKREDLLHGGAHKTNNVLGQALLAQSMGKKRIIAETGAGQHGVAVAMAGALFNIPTEIFMGIEDIERQKLNVFRMKLCGAKVNQVEVTPGKGTLKDAVSESLRDWITNVDTTYYMLGSVTGPYPYPFIVRDFQKVIGEEAREQILKLEGKLPAYIVACVGGGSNAIGIFNAFLEDDVKLVGVEAGGDSQKHGATLSKGSEGIFQGSRSFVLQDKDGQIEEAHSISAGLDYPGVGPQHAYLKDISRAEYVSVNDKEAVEALKILSEDEGIICALESAHAVAHVLKMNVSSEDIVIINLSGRGDKDMYHIMGFLGEKDV